MVVMASRKDQSIDWKAFLAGIAGGKTDLEYCTNRNIFCQGQTANSVFYIRRGRVRLSVISDQGKEAVVANLKAGEFFGEGCLAGQPTRTTSATTMTACHLARIAKRLMARLLHEKHGISELFVEHLLSRNTRLKEDLVDQLFNSSEKRLARILLLLAHFGKDGRTETVHPGINRENLAQMVGTTRPRISHFMNKFKKLGFIDYKGELTTVHSGLLKVVLGQLGPISNTRKFTPALTAVPPR